MYFHKLDLDYVSPPGMGRRDTATCDRLGTQCPLTGYGHNVSCNRLVPDVRLGLGVHGLDIQYAFILH